MAIQFDESDDYFQITDDASLTLPNDDWCVGIWTRVTDNTGTLFQYLLSNNNYGANNSFNLFFGEDLQGGGVQDNWDFAVEDGDGTNIELYATTDVGDDGKWRLVIAQRNTGSNQLELWYCEPGQTATLEDSEADTDLGIINGGDWYIGRRSDGDADRYYGNIACEIFVLTNTYLTQAEIEMLGAGLPIWALSKASNLDLYLPMYESVATLRDLINSNDATRNSAPTTAEHAPIVAPVGAIGVKTGAAVGTALPVLGHNDGIHSLVFGGLVVR